MAERLIQFPSRNWQLAVSCLDAGCMAGLKLLLIFGNPSCLLKVNDK